MISSVRQLGSMPLEAIAPATSAISPVSVICRPEMLTLMVIAGFPVSVCQARSWRVASSRTQRPSATIVPVSSANGMKSTGEIEPRVGWSHRASASKPVMRSDVSSTMGWNARWSSPRSSAPRSSFLIPSRTTVAP